jgi:DNA-binding CsgD family transcriptional regulator
VAHLDLSASEVVAVRRVLALDPADHPDFPCRVREVLAALHRLIPCDRLDVLLLDAEGAVELRVQHPTDTCPHGHRDRLLVKFPLSGRGSVRLRLERVGRRFEARHVELIHMLQPVLARQLRPPVGAVHTGPQQSLASLSVAELQVLRLVAVGGTNQDVAVRLGVSEATVRKHLEHVYRKLGVTNRTAAAARVTAPATV